MRAVLSREQSREFDRYASDWANVPSLLLMENAGRGATDCLLSLRHGTPGRVVVVAGPGNNGGDGFVLARRLRVLGHPVEVWLIGDSARLAGDARVMWTAYIGLGGDHEVLASEADLPRLQTSLGTATTVIDALFGTGLARPIEGLHARVIGLVQQSPGYICALDIPSGLDANTGRVLGVAVRAHATVTFGSEKLGHFTSAGADYCGKLELVDIGVPPQLCEQLAYGAERLTAEDLAPRFLRRAASSHKGRAGRVAVIAGHAGTSGAALLAARGALRMGAGLVTHVGLPETIAGIESRVLEAMTSTLDPAALELTILGALRGMSAVVLGPGLGRGDAERRIVEFVVEHVAIPVIVDADALTLLAQSSNAMTRAEGPRILLPHRGELGRLLGTTAETVDDDPYLALGQAVQLLQTVVVLKGAYTYVGAPNQKISVVGSPCGAMGTAGAGDVLSGAVAALAVDHEPRIAALIGVYLHNRAGASWVAESGADRGLLASDIADHLPAAIAELSRVSGRMTV